MMLPIRFLSLVLVAITCTSLPAEKKTAPITRPGFDRSAPVVPLFEGMEQRKFDVKLVHRDEKSGQLFVTNTTDSVLTVEMPEAFVGVQVLHQFQFPPQGQATGQNQNSLNQLGQTLGAGQMTGGGTNNQSSALPNGFFSVPAGATVRLPVASVCLEHGRPTPGPRMEYRIVPVETVTSDPVLKGVLTQLAQGRIPQKPAQAAAWHLANGKSRTELASMMARNTGLPVPLFSGEDLRQTEALLNSVRKTVAQDQTARSGEVPDHSRMNVSRERVLPLLARQ